MNIRAAFFSAEPHLGSSGLCADQNISPHRKIKPPAQLFCQESRLIVAPRPLSRAVQRNRYDKISDYPTRGQQGPTLAHHVAEWRGQAFQVVVLELMNDRAQRAAVEGTGPKTGEWRWDIVAVATQPGFISNLPATGQRGNG